MKKKILHIILFFFIGLSLNGQYRDFLSAPYEWANDFVLPALDSAFAIEDAVALVEHNRMAVRGLKAAFMHVYYEQKGMIQYQNQKGIYKHNAFLLPKALDPLYEGQFIPIEDKVYQPFFNVRMLFFAGRIKKPNGDVIPAVFRYAFPDKKRIINNQYERVFLYYVQVTNLEPGDVLEYHYKYEVPYDVNWMHFNSSRIFHESDIAKQNYQFQFELNKKLRSTFKGELAEKTWEEGNTSYRLWTRDNLSARIDEPGSRIHKDFEHIVFKFNENNLAYVYRHPRTNQVLPARFYNFIARQRQSRDFWFRRVARRNFVFDKQSRMFRTWIEDHTTEGQSPVEKLRTLNGDIAQNFRYHDDSPYYSLQDFGLENMGDYTFSGRIRDISRHNVYTKIFNRLEFKRYKVLYVLDKRVGDITEDYPSNLFFNERVYFTNDSSQAFVFPKRNRLGYELNELPFYLEGTRGFGYTVDALFENGATDFQSDSISISSSENKRKTIVQVKMDLENKSFKAKASIDLFGQFSTLTRGAYLYNEIDSTINPNYGIRVYDNVRNVSNIKSTSDFNPEENFHCRVLTEFISIKSIYQVEDTASLYLDGLLNFITWNDFDFEKRKSSFYPDFAFEDEFEFSIEVSKNIQLLNSTRFSMENESGEFFFEVKQEDNGPIGVNARWKLNEEPIPASKISLLKDFYDLIQKTLEMEIRMQIES